MKTRTAQRMLAAIAAALLLSLMLGAAVYAQESNDPPPAAPIVNDDGGAVRITGQVDYSYPYFTSGVAQPMVILEDQAGFVDRNEYFLMPVASQTIGQITSDFFTSPFTYSIALPIEPAGTYSDVDNDDTEDQGVQVFAIAYWDNTFGDPFLEERDLHGGGWSTAYASTRISEDIETEKEIVGGIFLVYAPDDEQGFPSGFGEDGLLFTEDDPIVTLPKGYTIVNMDAEPFTFDRSRNPVVDLIEPQGIAEVDYSDQSYPDAFNSLVDLLIKEYAFTEYKEIDWEAKRTEFLPRFQAAADAEDSRDYQRALRDFGWSIPDGHVSGSFIRQDFQEAIAGGLGIAIRETDEEKIIVNFVLEGSPADTAGITLGTELTAIDGVAISDAIDSAIAHSAPFSTEHFKHLQQMRYVVRFPIETEVELTWVNADGDEVSETMKVISEYDSFSFSSFARGLTGFELPVDYRLLEEGDYGENDIGYVKLDSFSDNSLLTIQLWERMIRALNRYGVGGLIIDMRQNGGGSGFLADQMAAYFYQEPHVLGNTGYYEDDHGEFFFDPDSSDRFYLPPEDLRYDGKVAVIVGPFCLSACEFFTYDMTIDDRSDIVGHYPTGGLGGSIKSIKMPEDEYFTYTIGRAVDADGEIHIEGKGVAPTVEVPVTAEVLLADEDDDVLLDAAIAHLDELLTVETIDGGEIALGDTITGTLASRTVVRYTLPLSAGDIISIYVDSEEFDTYLALYLGGEDPIMTDDDSYETNAALEELEVPSDLVLTVEVSSALGDEEGEYTLKIVEVLPDEEEEEGEDSDDS